MSVVTKSCLEKRPTQAPPCVRVWDTESCVPAAAATVNVSQGPQDGTEMASFRTVRRPNMAASLVKSKMLSTLEASSPRACMFS